VITEGLGHKMSENGNGAPVEIGRLRFADWDAARAAARDLVIRDVRVMSPDQVLLVREVAQRFPLPQPTPEELDRRIAEIARAQFREAPARPVVPSPFDDAIAAAQAAEDEAHESLSAAQSAYDAAKRARGQLKMGVSTAADLKAERRAVELELAIENARGELHIADMRWTRARSRRFALEHQRSRWRSTIE
jgi:hypothetical protein